MVYRLLRVVARLALRWYYRSIEIVGADRIPMRGPVILAANHNNALVDALLVAGSIDREVRLTAKATLLDNPFTRVVVQTVGIVPLRRATDETRATGGPPGANRNVGAFQAVVDTLAAGGVILIFPEGISHSSPMLAPLKTGCARMATQAAEAGVRDICIIPVGLTFEAKGLPRSRVAVRVGDPIPVDHNVLKGSDPVSTLTQVLESGLRNVTLNFPTSDDAATVIDVAQTLADALRETPSLDETLQPLSHTVQLAQYVEAVRQRLPVLPTADRGRALAFVNDLRAWRDQAHQLHISTTDVGMATGVIPGLGFMVRELVIAVVLGPVALWGRVNHWLPLRTAVFISQATSRNPDEPAMHTLVGGAVLVLLSYTLVAGVLWRVVGWPWAVVYLASLVPAASLDFWWSDRLKSAIQRARGYLALRTHPERAEWLAVERTRLRREASELTTLFL